MFGIILIAVISLLHAYVFWRASSVPLLKRHIGGRNIFAAGLLFWALFAAGRLYGHGHSGRLASMLEFAGMNWMAILFLVFVVMFAVDLVTGFGFLLPRVAPKLRGLALAAGLVLSAIALYQGLRPPVVTEYTVKTAGLPAELDGTVIIAVSDLHIRSLLDKDLLADRISRIQAEKPDLVVLLGDIFEGHGPPPHELLPVLRGLSAPLGVWSVNGNHENHGSDLTPLLEAAGFHVLRNGWTEIQPGLVLAGVDDLTAVHRAGREPGGKITGALAGRPPAATILLTHTPWQYGEASRAGVGLMLAGHTHGGQIWPFGYLVKHYYPLLEGRYEVNAMTVIVCRGTGTWGPRMRLWHPSEMLRITLVQ